MKVYSTKEFKVIEHKALKLRNILLSRPQKGLIEEWCDTMGYHCNTLDTGLPVIKSKNYKKSVFVQEIDNDLFAIESVPVFDKNTDIISFMKVKENLTELLYMFNLYKMVQIDFLSKNILPKNVFIEDTVINMDLLCGIMYFQNNMKPIQA